jgi:hypothetical protein
MLEVMLCLAIRRFVWRSTIVDSRNKWIAFSENRRNAVASSSLEITIQRGSAGGWPVVVEDHRSGTLLPVRSEGQCRAALNSRNCLQDDELLQLNPGILDNQCT